MKRFIVSLMTIVMLVIPVVSMAGSAFNFGFTGGDYGSVTSVGFTSVNYDSVYIEPMPVRYVRHTTIIRDVGYRCYRPIHYRPISYRPANWYAHGRGAIVRERHVSRRVRYYGGRW